MKTLNGNNGFSQFENNKLKNLKMVAGGSEARTEKSCTQTTPSANCNDTTRVYDNGSSSTVTVCSE